jgi:uncharacterized membrane protein YcaP (DUF421 family)
MDTVIRGLTLYVFLLAALRFSGKRSFAEMTTFDFVLLLVIAETVQQGLTGQDYSLVTSMVLITTLVCADIGLSLVKQRWKGVEKWIDGLPVIILQNGEPVRRHMDRERVDEEDVLAAARRLHGLERLDQIKYAILERDGGITIVPSEKVIREGR